MKCSSWFRAQSLCADGHLIEFSLPATVNMLHVVAAAAVVVVVVVIIIIIIIIIIISLSPSLEIIYLSRCTDCYFKFVEPNLKNS
jgi:hypothetical protein